MQNYVWNLPYPHLQVYRYQCTFILLKDIVLSHSEDEALIRWNCISHVYLHDTRPGSDISD